MLRFAAGPLVYDPGAATMARPLLIILYVRDQERSRRFYAAVLGAAPTLDVPGMTEFDLPGGASLGLMPERGARALLGDAVPSPDSATGVPRCELYLRVADPTAFVERAVAAGGRLIDGLRARSWGEVVAYLVDADGHVVAFAQASEA